MGTIISKIKKSILGGCIVHFVDCYSRNCNPSYQHVWKLAENFGAVCVRAFSERVTHVVIGKVENSLEKRNNLSKRYKDKGINVVGISFIYDAAVHFRKPDEWNHDVEN